MDKIVSAIGRVPETKTRNDDDISDRILYRYTVNIMILLAIIVSTKQYVGEPIQCWVPAEFTGSHEEYTNNFCWIRNTYYLAYDKNIPKEHEPEKRHVIPYYQWMPIFLSLQAFLYYLPTLLWRATNNRSGVNVHTIVEAAESFSDSIDRKNSTIKCMTLAMNRYLSNQKDTPSSFTLSLKNIFARSCFYFCGRRHGNYLVSLYLIYKFLAIAVVISQIITLNYFLGQDFHTYGLEAIKSILYGMELSSPRFPRVTMCDFKIRRLGNVQRFTVQCVLPINLFNEKIFIFLWFWLIFVVIVLLFYIVMWLSRILLRSSNKSYVKKHLELMNKLNTDADRKMAKSFVHDYLRKDGVFVLRLVGHNTNAITVTEFVCQLWNDFVAAKNSAVNHSKDYEI